MLMVLMADGWLMLATLIKDPEVSLYDITFDFFSITLSVNQAITLSFGATFLTLTFIHLLLRSTLQNKLVMTLRAQDFTHTQ